MFKEHVQSGGGAAATMEVRRGRLIVTVGPAVLREAPWFRGGAGVTVLVGWGHDAGRLTIQRDGEHRLLAVVRGRHSLDKLPPVSLSMALLEHMPAMTEHPPEPVAYVVRPRVLEVRLPSWAAPPVPIVAPPSPWGGLRPVEPGQAEAQAVAS